MNITISYRDISPTKDEKDGVEEASNHFEEFFRNLVSINWEFHTERTLCAASCSLHSKSGFYRARASSEHLITSISLVTQKLIKQRRRKKKMQSRILRKPKVLDIE
jgi:ribosomal subunit interface protein